MLHQPGSRAARRELPKFLETNPVGLGFATMVKFKLGDELLAERSTTSLCENRHSCTDVHAECEVGSLGAIMLPSHVTNADADDRAVFHQSVCSGESGKDLDADVFRLLAQPAAQCAK